MVISEEREFAIFLRMIMKKERMTIIKIEANLLQLKIV